MFNILSEISNISQSSDIKTLMHRFNIAKNKGIPNGCILELDLLSFPQEEINSFNSFTAVSRGGRYSLLHHTIDSIYLAAEDPRVIGLIARVQPQSVSMAAAQEIREAIVSFGLKKPTLSWAETYPNTLSYYLASAFREVWIQPSGTISLMGFSTNTLFIHDVLEKIGVKAQFITCGKYKSAANRFIENKYTNSQRKADEHIIASLQEQVWKSISISRNLTISDIDTLANFAPIMRDIAVSSGLVDYVGFRDEAYIRIKELTKDSTKALIRPYPNNLLWLKFSQYMRASQNATKRFTIGNKAKSQIAIVHLNGLIINGYSKPQSLPLNRTNIGGDTVGSILRKLTSDDQIKAIVLRINSPGGSVIGSETIWREVTKVRDYGKVVIASMGSVAASGGYYVSMAANEIFANAATITGSIGVLAGKFIFQDLKSQLGINTDFLCTNKNSDTLSSDKMFNNEQKTQIEIETKLFYTDFINRVSNDRNLSFKKVNEVAQGRVWTGLDAKKHGLVDHLGGLHEAITRAKVLSGFDSEEKIQILNYPNLSWLELFRANSHKHSIKQMFQHTLVNAFEKYILELMNDYTKITHSTNTICFNKHNF